MHPDGPILQAFWLLRTLVFWGYASAIFCHFRVYWVPHHFRKQRPRVSQHALYRTCKSPHMCCQSLAMRGAARQSRLQLSDRVALVHLELTRLVLCSSLYSVVAIFKEPRLLTSAPSISLRSCSSEWRIANRSELSFPFPVFRPPLRDGQFLGVPISPTC